MTEPEVRDPLGNMRRSLHDLAQPLAVLAGLVDLMLLDMEETDPRHQEIQLINQQLEQVLSIIGEIRRLVREIAAGSEISRNIPAPS